MNNLYSPKSILNTVLVLFLDLKINALACQLLRLSLESEMNLG